jgi:hypothetical protein
MSDLVNIFAGVAVGAVFSPFWMAIGRTFVTWLKQVLGRNDPGAN